MLKPIRYIATLLLLAGFLPKLALAIPLSIVPSPPDMSFGAVSVNYDHLADTLTVTGFATNFIDENGVSHSPTDGTTLTTLAMTAIIDSTGVLVSGSLSIEGVIPSLGITTSSLLLMADLTLFGDVNPLDLDTFNFLASATGGLLAGPHYGAEVGVILNGTGTFNNNWAENFGQAFGGTADITTPSSVVSVSATWPLLGVGLLGIALARRRCRV